MSAGHDEFQVHRRVSPVPAPPALAGCLTGSSLTVAGYIRLGIALLDLRILIGEKSHCAQTSSPPRRDHLSFLKPQRTVGRSSWRLPLRT